MIKSCDIDADGYHLSDSGDRWLDCLDRVLMDLKDFRFFSLSLSCFVRLFSLDFEKSFLFVVVVVKVSVTQEFELGGFCLL